jgi:hypothetical protein
MDDYYRLPDRNGSFEARQRTQSLVIEEIGNKCREGKKTKRIHILDDDVPKGFKKAQLFFQTASRNASSRTNQRRNLQSQQQRKKEVYKTHTRPLVFWSVLTRVQTGALGVAKKNIPSRLKEKARRRRFLKKTED